MAVGDGATRRMSRRAVWIAAVGLAALVMLASWRIGRSVACNRWRDAVDRATRLYESQGFSKEAVREAREGSLAQGYVIFDEDGHVMHRPSACTP